MGVGASGYLICTQGKIATATRVTMVRSTVMDMRRYEEIRGSRYEEDWSKTWRSEMFSLRKRGLNKELKDK